MSSIPISLNVYCDAFVTNALALDPMLLRMRVAIVGAGLSGLSVAYYLKKARPEWQIQIFEKESVAGGKLRSSLQDGFTFDWGPNGFLSNLDDTFSLAKDLGLGNKLQSASEHAKHRLLYKFGALHSLPAKPSQFLSSSLISPVAKLRAMLEPVIARARNEEESVYDFVARHFGKEVAEVFAGPASLGITAGDAKTLSLDALFPRFRKLERDHGSLIKALMAGQKQAQAATVSRLTSFRSGGVQRLTNALTDSLGSQLQKDEELKFISKEADLFWLEFSRGRVEKVDKLILATPSFVSAKLLEPLLPDVAVSLRCINYADVVVMGLGYRRVDVPQIMDAFGFLVARNEAVRSLGVLYSSSVFPDQAPEDKVMLRVICGGSLDPAFIGLSDTEMTDVVGHDLQLSMGITAKPEFCQIVRWPRGIPQYTLGHSHRVTSIMQGSKQLAGLYLTGNAFYGVGVNDCVRDAKRVVAELIH